MILRIDDIISATAPMRDAPPPGGGPYGERTGILADFTYQRFRLGRPRHQLRFIPAITLTGMLINIIVNS